MTQPTQELPPWLSASFTTLTNPTGGLTTITAIVRLPLTYYGPSIPLGTDGVWTYGGLTSPASTPSPTTATPSTSSPSTLTTTTAPPTSTSHSATSSSNTQTPSPTVSPAAVPLRSNRLSRAGQVGIILGALLGSVLLLLLLLLFLRWRTRRRASTYHTPIWTGWEILPTRHNGAGRPDEGSLRSGEVDPFLPPKLKSMQELGVGDPLVAKPRLVSTQSGQDSEAPVASVGEGVARVSRQASAHTGGDRSSSNVSDYGTVIDPATIGVAHGEPSLFRSRAESGSDTAPSTSKPPSTIGGHILPPSLLRTMVDAWDRRASVPATSSSSSKNGSKSSQSRSSQTRSSQSRNGSRILRHVGSAPSIPEGWSPLIPPTPLNPDRISAILAGAAFDTSNTQTQRSSVSEMPEVLTASRVRAQDLGPRSTPSSPVTLRTQPIRTSWAGPLGGLSRLSRLSWFRNEDSSSRTSSRSRPHSSSGPSEVDLEGARSLPATLLRSSEMGMNVNDGRPLSSVSARSGASGSTIYHDALEEPEQPPPVPPLPRAYLPGGNGSPIERHSTRYEPVPTNEPLDYEDAPPRGDAQGVPGESDILDLPAPRPMSSFSGSSQSSRRPLYPPGLGLSPPSSRVEFNGNQENPTVTIDVLEDLPPSAEEGWRTLASNLPESDSRRATFGMPTIIHPQEHLMSEMGSIVSVHSRLGPHSGPSPTPTASSRRAFSSSAGSGPLRSASSAQTRSISVSSDGRRRMGQGSISPATSAFGRGPNGSGHRVRRSESSDYDTTSDTIMQDRLMAHVSPASDFAGGPSGARAREGGEWIRLVDPFRDRPTDQDLAEWN